MRGSEVPQAQEVGWDRRTLCSPLGEGEGMVGAGADTFDWGGRRGHHRHIFPPPEVDLKSQPLLAGIFLDKLFVTSPGPAAVDLPALLRPGPTHLGGAGQAGSHQKAGAESRAMGAQSKPKARKAEVQSALLSFLHPRGCGNSGPCSTISQKPAL